MGKKNLYPGQDRHPGNDLFLEEVRRTRDKAQWKEELLGRVNAELAPFGGSRSKVGHRIDEVQIQQRFSTNTKIIFEDLGIAWVQFNTYDPYTKKPAYRTLRFSPDPGCLMLLVRSPKDDGDYDWYLLARKKYQFGAEKHLIEFSRGWIPDCQPNEMGWDLMDRDFPGLRDIAINIHHTQLGSAPWENTAEFANKISYHIIVVTLAKPMTKEELKKRLVQVRIRYEYEGKPGYSNLDRLAKNDLVSEPMVFDLEEAAGYLNAHLTDDPEATDVFFNEDFSRACWTAFLSTCGWKHFPHLMPETCDILAP